VVHPDEVEDMARHARTILLTLAASHLHAATCMYSNTADQHFVVAAHPGHDNVTVACGFSGHGFKFVPVIGEVLADLTMTGRTDNPIGVFDPRRGAHRVRASVELT